METYWVIKQILSKLVISYFSWIDVQDSQSAITGFIKYEDTKFFVASRESNLPNSKKFLQI